MNHNSTSPKQPLTLGSIVQTGIEFAQKTFLFVFPFSFLMSGLGFFLQPNSIPAFAEWVDWATLFLLALGVFTLCVLHAAILLQMNAKIHDHTCDFKTALESGLRKAPTVFLVWLLYSAFIILGFILVVKLNTLGEDMPYPKIVPIFSWILIMIPVLFLTVSFYLSLFLAVLAEHKPGTSRTQKIIAYFRESAVLVKGHWWKMFGLMLLMAIIMAVLDALCQLLQKELVVAAVLFCVFARAAIVPFWYGCILAMIVALKAKHSHKQMLFSESNIKKIKSG